MHMPGSDTGTTKWVARILPEGRTDESTTNGCLREAPPVRKRDSSAAGYVCPRATLPTLPRQAIAWAFIAPVALFLTHPTAEQQSVFDEPFPPPAELEPLLPAQ